MKAYSRCASTRWWPISPRIWPISRSWGLSTPTGCRVRSVKVYGDGSLGSRGALLKKPYADVDSVYHGLLRASREHMLEVANWCEQHNFQMVAHCIGDSMDRFMLDVYAEVLKGFQRQTLAH